MTPRGIRDNNPGNIRHGATPWVGELPSPDGGFCVFTESVYGLRAIARVLANYQRYDYCRTVSDFIRRWAPPSENDTDAYILAVCHRIGLVPDGRLDVTNEGQMVAMIKAIVLHENGVQPYSDSLIEQAVSMAKEAA